MTGGSVFFSPPKHFVFPFLLKSHDLRSHILFFTTDHPPKHCFVERRKAWCRATNFVGDVELFVERDVDGAWMERLIGVGERSIVRSQNIYYVFRRT